MNNHRLVYSDEIGSRCPKCGKTLQKCVCRASGEPVGDGRVRVARQTKGRKGKGVSLITGLPLAEKELKALAKELKQCCGCGGTVREGIIELQTDQRDLLVEELKKRGYQAGKAGG
ncbi:stress response translation initiation inhibitor YciH [Geothermobacter hydrogeniphilus]|uniref:Stress response translation initiation inhibitor YciH n=1 Tax=Geothermobacter hydrogeniphilus TaxID=1969733 RepID=A0A2K2H908_9BACT|nr:translation initiation factor Sui1 [Geothermobacter hydrogeniphilus]PNU19713.1 stress response translation initiation inhibitor YciH [Geothermobacter hydrogeniphilus]